MSRIATLLLCTVFLGFLPTPSAAENGKPIARAAPAIATSTARVLSGVSFKWSQLTPENTIHDLLAHRSDVSFSRKRVTEEATVEVRYVDFS